MANIAGTYYSNQSYNPKINYSVSCTQTGRSATSVTYSFTVGYARQNGSYLYDVYINYSIGGQSGNVLLKANNDGSATSSCSFSVTCSTNAAGGTLYAKIYSWSNTDSTHWQNGFDTGDKDVNKSTFNTAPYWASGALISLNPNGVVREDTSSVTVSWPVASDNETTSGMTYKVDRYINGNFSSTIASSATSTSITDNIGAGNSGNVYTYRVTPKDNYGVTGGTLTNSQSLTKNTMYAATISGGSAINNNTTSFTISVSGGSNSMGSGNIYRDINSPNLTIYNNGISTGTITITIYRSGTAPTTPYIKYDDIKNLYKNATNQSGSFKINLNTANDFGSYKTNSINISVDLRDTPNAPSGITTSGTKTVGSTAYYIPNLQNITVSWTNGSDKVDGSALTYEIQGSTSLTSGWRTLVSGIASGSGTTNKVVSIPYDSYSGGSNYYFKVIGYNAYGLSASVNSGAIVLHKYSAPTISLGTSQRTTTQLIISIATILNTSIPSTAFVSGKRNYALKVKGTTTYVKASTALTASPQTVTITGLEAAKEYTLEVTVNDSTGLNTVDVKSSLDISKYIPIMSVRDKGVGINAYADNTYKFVVGGSAKVTDTLNVATLQTTGNATITGTLKTTGAINAGGALTTPSIELTRDGAIPYIDFSNDLTSDYDMRLELTSDSVMTIRGGSLGLVSNDFITTGAYGWKNTTYGGGWYMSDTTWIRTSGSKDVYVNTMLRADGGLQVGASGSKFNVTSTGAITSVAESRFSNGTYTDPLNGTTCSVKVSGRIACNIINSESYRFVDTNAIITSRSGTDGGFDFWLTGTSGNRITFDGVKIYKVVNGTWTVLAG